MQEQLIFFDENNSPNDYEIDSHLNHPDCPLNQVIVSDKNEGSMNMLKLFAHNAYARANHSCRGMSFVIYCSAGQGKTYLVRQFAGTIGIPFVFIQSDSLLDNNHLFNLLSEAFQSITPLTEVSEDTYVIPPCIVFFDEVHALSNKAVDGLLNPMEFNDGIMRITSGKGNKTKTITVDCREICWVGATTEEGKLPGPFASRLETSITWHPAGEKEIYEIVKSKYPQLPDEACKAVTKYRKIPRAAVAFARLMTMAREKDEFLTWESAADTIAKNMNLDEHGMPLRQVSVLAALGQRPISKSILALQLKCNIEALEKVILPPLLQYGENGALIVPTRKGYAITKAGLVELDKRNIDHKGDRITVECIERN